ncbi:hypothetical protein EXE42_04295 [Halorubrum sp. SP3]|nr:hypothetical protein EXE42_04295 [Halorubrum sp. SP3]
MVQTTEAKQVCRAASTVLFPELEFGVKSCGKYTREDFQEILSRIAFDQEFANTGGKTLQLDRDEHVDITATARNPLAKSLLYHLRNLSTDAIIDQFDGDPRGTTKECASCGVSTEKPLWVREHSCPACGFEADRDANAAWNILSRGLEDVGVGYSESTPVETALPTDTGSVSVKRVVETGSPTLKERTASAVSE